MLRGARSSCSVNGNGKEKKVSPQEEALEILKNFLDSASRLELTEARWERVCFCATQMAQNLNRTLPLPKKKENGRRGSKNGIKGLVPLCLETEKKINKVRGLPPDQRLTILEHLQEIRL